MLRYLFFFFFQLYRYTEIIANYSIKLGSILKLYFESRSILIQTFNGIRLLFKKDNVPISIFTKCSFGLYKSILNFKIYRASKNIYL